MKTKGRWFKAHKVSIEIKRIGAGMLGEQGGLVGEVSRVEIKRRRRMKRRAKVQKIFFVCRKNKTNQINLGWNKLT